jgi:hypothetical protein
MSLTSEQRGVARGIAIGAICTVVAVAGAAIWHPAALLPADNTVARIEFALKWTLLPAACLLAAVARLAKHRFFTPEDIDGGGLSSGTPRAKVLQSVLQNTLEQVVLAGFTYLIWVVVVPHAWLASTPAAAVLFLIGRLWFFRGYERGAPARAAGFTLTFYPSVLLLAVSAVVLGGRFFAGQP